MKRMQYLRTIFAAVLKRKCGGNVTYVVTSGKLRLRCETPAAVAQSACERKQGRKNHLKRLKQIAFQKNIRRFQKNGIMKKIKCHLQKLHLVVENMFGGNVARGTNGGHRFITEQKVQKPTVLFVQELRLHFQNRL